MKLQLQILIIGILIFSSNSILQYTCSVSGTGANDGFYNAPIGAGGICTNTGVCQDPFSDNPNSPASEDTLTGDCFHCESFYLFLDQIQTVPYVTCRRYCQEGYTDSPIGGSPSIPIIGNCQHCLTGLVNKNDICECSIEGQYLTSINSGICGTKCESGYAQIRQGIYYPVLFNHCLHCYYGLINNNDVCECPIQGEYLTDIAHGQCGTACDYGYTDQSDGSEQTTFSTGHCLNCLSTHTYYNRQCSRSCQSGEYYSSWEPVCGTSCVPGFTDVQNSQYPNNPIEGNCIYCVRGLIFSFIGCHCRVSNQYLTSITSETCGRSCETGYTDNFDGSAPNQPLSGHCIYCQSGYLLFEGQCYEQ